RCSKFPRETHDIGKEDCSLSSEVFRDQDEVSFFVMISDHAWGEGSVIYSSSAESFRKSSIGWGGSTHRSQVFREQKLISIGDHPISKFVAWHKPIWIDQIVEPSLSGGIF